jgi:hypothetical protein
VDYGEYGEKIWGFRRFAAYLFGLSQKLAVPDKIPVQLYPASVTVIQRRTLAATENLQRQDLTDPQKFKLCSELMELNPDWTRQDLAAHLNKSPATITHYLSPEGLIAEALQAFLDGKLGFSKAYAIRNAPDQPKALALALNGSTTRDDLARESRRQRSGQAQPSVRMPRIKIPLANDVATGMVTVAGESIDLDDAETLLKEALKSIRAARKKNLDCKTAQAVWRDVAKAGA